MTSNPNSKRNSIRHSLLNSKTNHNFDSESHKSDLNPSKSVITNEPMTVHSMIVAAGKGSRFGSDIPKQFTKINNQTILELSVAALNRSQFVNDVLIVISKNDQLTPTLKFDLPTNYVTGGAERWQSVAAGVHAIFEKGAYDDDLILIHDAARPCVLASHIDAVIHSAYNSPYGAILGVPVADTIKRVNEANQEIMMTVDRSNLWLAQTPQVFRAGYLKQVLQKVAEENLMITDEASAFEMMDLPIKIVQGNNQNIKLTYPEDIFLIEMILKSR